MTDIPIVVDVGPESSEDVRPDRFVIQDVAEEIEIISQQSGPRTLLTDEERNELFTRVDRGEDAVVVAEEIAVRKIALMEGVE